MSCVFLWGCASNSGVEDLRKWMTSNGKVKVLCTIAMVEDLVKQVGGEYVDVLTLVRGELDPHSYQLVKGDDEKLAYADIIYYNGLGLEHGPSLRDYLIQSEKAVGLGNMIMKEYPELILRYNGSIDPHIWMDSKMWSMTISHIVVKLAQFDPAHAAIFQENGDRVRQEMVRTHQQLREEMLRVPEKKRYLVTSHDAFNYFARAYLATDEEIESGEWQKRFEAPEGLAPESQLSTTDLQLVIDHMRKYDINVIFPESNVSQASIWKLVDAGQEQGLQVVIAADFLYGDAMGPPGSSGDTYLKMIQYNVRTIARRLLQNGLRKKQVL